MRPLLKNYKLCKYVNKFRVSFDTPVTLQRLACAHLASGLPAGHSAHPRVRQRTEHSTRHL